MSIQVKTLIEKLNKKLPANFNAKLGGSMVLKGLKLLNRPAEDVDIIISRSFLFNKDDENKGFGEVYNVIRDLFPLQELYDMKCSNSYENVDQENYRFNLKVCENAYVFGFQVPSINFLVQEDYIPEDYYSELSLFRVPCIDVSSILTAKKAYNRPKDLMDFHEMQRIMFFSNSSI